MKFTAAFVSAILFALTPAVGAAALVSDTTGSPFIESTTVPDFLSVEAGLNQSLSKSYDLVFYHMEEGGGWSAIALRKVPSKDYELILLDGTDDPSKAEKNKQSRAVVPAAIAQQIEKAFRFLLTRGVFAPSGQRGNISGHARDCWILLRFSETQGIAGIAQHDALHMNRSPAAEAYRNLWAGLCILAGGSSEYRDEALTNLDRASARFVLMEEAKSKQ